ncbi:MAG: hypothetical protein HFJ54_07915 [Clostridia bacterium]|nr:hypothetical protein [Clostridia bacterium]
MKLYKINETLEHTYYQMPQELFDNEKYKSLSIEAKVIYSFLLNRMNLSKINKWINERGEIYLIYTRKEIQSKLNLSDKPVTRAFKELRESSLIKEEKQGFGKPNLIYIGKIEHEEKQYGDINNNLEAEDIRLNNQIKADYYIGENTNTDTANIRTKKKDNIKNKNKEIEVSQLSLEQETLEYIKQKCELSLFDERQRNIIENALDIMYYSNNLKIGHAILPQENVRSRMYLLNSSIIFYAFDKLNYLKADVQIKNSTNFIISCIYNAITEYYSDSELQFKIDYGCG